MVGEKLGTDTQLLGGIVALAVRGERREARLGARARSAILSGFSQAVGLVIGAPGRHQRLHHPVALEIMERAFGRVDRNLMKVGRPQPRLLRVEVGEEPALEQWVVAEIDARNDVRRQEGGLLGFGEEIRSEEHTSELQSLMRISYAV